MKANFFFVVPAVACIISCSDTRQEEAALPTYNNGAVVVLPAKPSASDSLALQSLMKPASVKSLPGLPADAAQNYTAAPGTARLNPAHGQPGHRCDIAVGAPLDSKPVQQVSNASVPPTTTITPALPAIVSTPAPVQKVAPGMNPPHGQPNHRCDIAVGAPLNSKPAAKTNAPAIVSTPAPVQKVAPGMNPPHGQPNHRCDIAVGAPLNSKPAAPVVTPPPPVITEPAKTDTSGN